ncbi:MAG TPA: hypothetical protein VFS55_14260 [Dokdonella sp.]|nr:hypothetical protein [Dokdonella sp.]
MQADSARRSGAALVLAASMSGPIVAHAIDAREQAVADIEFLIRHNWHLVEAHTSKGEPLPVLTPTGNEEMTLRFERSLLRVTGCRGFSEDFFLIEGRIVHWTPEPATSTMILPCSGRPFQMDEAMAVVLKGDPSYRLVPSTDGIERPQLELESPADMIVVFKGEPTAETRYGGPGDTIYFDIAPRTVRCSVPDQPACACLQVRELFEPKAGTYRPGHDEIGLGNAGPWQMLCDDIEGLDPAELRDRGLYLRLRRFRDPSATGAAFRYVTFGR